MTRETHRSTENLPPEDKPYAGMKVIDLSQGIAGPHCGMLLGLYGADVTKVEPPTGDWIRQIGKTYGEFTVLTVAYNRGKRSIALDLRQPQGVAAALRMIRQADVVVENFRPGVADRLGLGYEAVRAINPRALHVSVTGFGSSGPYAQRPCSDAIAQAFSGLMMVNRDRAGRPQRSATFIMDSVTGLYAFQAISVALFARERTGKGRRLEIDLMSSGAAIQAPDIAGQYLEPGPAIRSTPSGAYETADGWLVVAMPRPDDFKHFCSVVGRDAVGEDPRFQTPNLRREHMSELLEIVAEIMLEKSTQQWFELFEKNDVLTTPVHDYNDWLNDEHVKSVGAFSMVDQPGVGRVPIATIPGLGPIENGDRSAVAPRRGQHSREILVDYGFSPIDIDELIGGGVVGLPQEPDAGGFK